MTAYYNEIDKNAAEWLRQLIKMGAIAPGDVDTRSIVDVPSVELRAYDQLHFFAGVGVWSYALRQAGWPDDRPVVTGSCPCTPYSTAGKRRGAGDPKNLWWAMFWHIRQLHPQLIIGEQVSSKDGLEWWDSVSSDLEDQSYAAAALDLCAAGVGAPHIRQRLFWVAVSNGAGQQWARSPQSKGWVDPAELIGTSQDMALANTQGQREIGGMWAEGGAIAPHRSRLVHANGERLSIPRQAGLKKVESQKAIQLVDGPQRPGGVDNFWSDCEWLPFSDGKIRPVKSGLSPLVARTAPDLVRGGDPRVATEKTAEAKTMRIKGYGNSIVAPLAVEFIEAVMEVLDETTPQI